MLIRKTAIHQVDVEPAQRPDELKCPVGEACDFGWECSHKDPHPAYIDCFDDCIRKSGIGPCLNPFRLAVWKVTKGKEIENHVNITPSDDDL